MAHLHQARDRAVKREQLVNVTLSIRIHLVQQLGGCGGEAVQLRVQGSCIAIHHVNKRLINGDSHG